MVDDKCFLVNLNADPALNELLVYYLKVRDAHILSGAVSLYTRRLVDIRRGTQMNTFSPVLHQCIL